MIETARGTFSTRWSEAEDIFLRESYNNKLTSWQTRNALLIIGYSRTTKAIEARRRHLRLIGARYRMGSVAQPVVRDFLTCCDKYDGRPRISDMCDPLLSRLYEVHKEPRFDLYPGSR